MKKNFNVENVHSENSWLQGEINCSYETLVKVFGQPNAENDGYKTDAEWAIKFNDGTYATIYNWKNGHNYCGKNDGYDVEEIINWHIGGQNSDAVSCVKQAIFDFKIESKEAKKLLYQYFSKNKNYNQDFIQKIFKNIL